MRYDIDELLDLCLCWLDRLSLDFKLFMLTVLLGGACFGVLGMLVP